MKQRRKQLPSNSRHTPAVSRHATSAKNSQRAPGLSRRAFLANSAAAAAAVATTGFFSEVAAAPSDSPSETLHIGAIGVGNRGVDNIVAVAKEPGVEIAALCDVDEKFLADMVRRFPRASRHRDFRKMLDEPGLDAVIVSTPDHTHAHAASAALRRGLHVYCEKPLAHTFDEVRLLARLAGDMRLVTQMGNQWRSTDGYRRAVALVRAGTLGHVGEVHAWTDRPLWPQGIDRPREDEQPEVPDHLDWDLWLGPAPHRPYSAAYHPLKWRGFWDFGGGALGDMGSHLLDPIYLALELAYPTSIEADTTDVNDETYPAASTVRFTFAARGELPPVALTWYDGAKIPPESVTGTSRPPANGSLLVGTRAKMFIPERGGEPRVLPLARGDKIDVPKLDLPSAPGHHAEWALACKAGKATSSSFADVAPMVQTCHLGNIAIRLGRKFEWNADKAAPIDCPAAEALLRRDYRNGWELF